MANGARDKNRSEESLIFSLFEEFWFLSKFGNPHWNSWLCPNVKISPLLFNIILCCQPYMLNAVGLMITAC